MASPLINWPIIAALVAPLLLLNVVALFLFYHARTRPVIRLAVAIRDKWSAAEAAELCKSLETTCGASPFLRQCAAEVSGLVEALVGMLQFGDLMAQERAASLVACLTRGHRHNMMRFGRSGVVESCVTLAASGVNALVVPSACLALESLLGPPSSVAAAINRQRAKAAGAQQVLQGLRDEPTLSSEGRRAAAAALVNLAPALSTVPAQSRVRLSGIVARVGRFSRRSRESFPTYSTSAHALEEGSSASAAAAPMYAMTSRI